MILSSAIWEPSARLRVDISHAYRNSERYLDGHKDQLLAEQDSFTNTTINTNRKVYYLIVIGGTEDSCRDEHKPALIHLQPHMDKFCNALKFVKHRFIYLFIYFWRFPKCRAYKKWALKVIFPFPHFTTFQKISG